MWYPRDRKFLFLHVPKTGGSSVKNALTKRHKARLEEPRKKYRTRIGHESFSSVDFKASGIDPKTFFSFAFVRCVRPQSKRYCMNTIGRLFDNMLCGFEKKLNLQTYSYFPRLCTLIIIPPACCTTRRNPRLQYRNWSCQAGQNLRPCYPLQEH